MLIPNICIFFLRIFASKGEKIRYDYFRARVCVCETSVLICPWEGYFLCWKKDSDKLSLRLANTYLSKYSALA